MNNLYKLWAGLRSQPWFVTASSAAGGAVVSMIQDEMASGKIDWSRGGLNKLVGCAIIAAASAIIHLYRPAPGTNPNQ